MLKTKALTLTGDITDLDLEFIDHGEYSTLKSFGKPACMGNRKFVVKSFNKRVRSWFK